MSIRTKSLILLSVLGLAGLMSWRIVGSHKHAKTVNPHTASERAERAASEVAQSPPPKPIYLTVRLRPDVSAATLHRLNEVTEPDVVSTKSGTPLYSVVKESYGVCTAALGNLVVDANPQAFTDGTKPQLVADSVTLPAGPKVERETTVTIHFSGTLRQFVQLTVGTSGKRTEAAILEANPHLEGKWDSRLKGKVDLPYTTQYSSYTMRTTSLIDAQAIARGLKSHDPAVISAEAGYGYESVPHWKLSSIPPNQTTHTILPPNWPFHNVTGKLADLEQSKSPRWALIAIVDTGVAGGAENLFPLWENPVIGSGNDQGALSDRCQNDYYGCNFITATSPPLDDCESPNEFHHGTHIAGLVSGRLYAGKEELDHLVRLMILKAADNKAALKPDDVNNALIYAVSHLANIVNLSLTGDHQDAIESTIQSAPTVLFIAAAGNPTSGVGADLNDPNLGIDTGFPARLSGTRENVIGVASHDSEGKLSTFSNFGKDLIDLAAPGEQVPSLVNSGEQRAFNGTSQATALVSLTAGILYSQGIMRPSDIKHRILAATDFRHDLVNKVSSEGELNITKALLYKSDLVQFKDGHIEAGALKTPTKLVVNFQGYSVSVYLRGNLYKIVPRYSKESGKQIRVTFLQKGKLVHGYIDRLGTFSFTTNGQTRDVSSDDVIDIIPRLNDGSLKSP
jgi:hypothetical protein